MRLAQACAHGDLGSTVFLKEYVLNKQALFLTAEFSLADVVSLKRIFSYEYTYLLRIIRNVIFIMAKVKVKVVSNPFVTPWIIQSIEFSMQEYWSG